MTPDAYADFGRFNAFSAHGRGAVFALFPVAMLAMGAVHFGTGAAALGAAFAAAGALVPLGYLLFFRRTLRTQIRANRLAEARIAYRVRIGARGLAVSNGREAAEYGWERVYKTYLTSRYAYVYLTPAKAFILPYEGIREGGRDELERLFRENLSPERLKRVRLPRGRRARAPR